jgi:hypothetical protein
MFEDGRRELVDGTHAPRVSRRKRGCHQSRRNRSRVPVEYCPWSAGRSGRHCAGRKDMKGNSNRPREWWWRSSGYRWDVRESGCMPSPDRSLRRRINQRAGGNSHEYAGLGSGREWYGSWVLDSRRRDAYHCPSWARCVVAFGNKNLQTKP